MPKEDRSGDNPFRGVGIRVGQWLLVKEAMSASELQTATGIERKQLKRILNRIGDESALEFEPTGVATASPGHPKGFYRLTNEGRERLEEMLDANRHLGLISPGQGWVRAEVSSSGVPALMDVFSAGELVASAEWIARLEGDAHGFLFVFAPELGSQPADNLLGALQKLDIRLSSGVVRDIEAPDSFLRRAAAVRASAR